MISWSKRKDTVFGYLLQLFEALRFKCLDFGIVKLFKILRLKKYDSFKMGNKGTKPSLRNNKPFGTGLFLILKIVPERR